MNTQPIRVALFEDNNSLRNVLSQLISGSDGFECVGAFPNCMQVLEEVAACFPDVVVMDIEMPGVNGIDAVRQINKHFPEVKILMQTVFEDHEKIFSSILAGASGYILKSTSSSRFLEFVRETYEGGAPMSPSVASTVLRMVASQGRSEGISDFNLSEREKQILACLVKGMSYKLTAHACTISIDTVRGHIRHIYEKLHVNSKSEAVAKAIRNRIV